MRRWMIAPLLLLAALLATASASDVLCNPGGHNYGQWLDYTDTSDCVAIGDSAGWRWRPCSERKCGNCWKVQRRCGSWSPCIPN